MENEQLIQSIYVFADLLLKEILEQRCDPENRFYLPGLPVTNQELLYVLAPVQPEVNVNPGLRSLWEELSDTLMTEDVYEDAPRLLKLRWLYRLDEVWLLAVVLAFIEQSDPKYKKAFLVLQGDSGNKGLDLSLVKAFAGYLGIAADKSMMRLASDCREKADLFERREDSQLILRKNVFWWLCGSDNETQHGCRVYPLMEEPAVIHVKESAWVSGVAEGELGRGSRERLVFEIQGRPGAGKKYFSRECAAKLGYRICVFRLSYILELGRQEGHELLGSCFFSCRVNGCIPYLDLTECDMESMEARHLVESIVSEYKLIFIGTTPDQILAKAVSFSTQKVSLDELSVEDSLALWNKIGSQYQVAEDVDYKLLAGKYRLLPADICEVFVRAKRRCGQNEEQQIDNALILSCVRECSQLSENILMEQIHTVFRWEDLKVKPENARAMKLACAHLKYRFQAQEYLGDRYPYGRGVSVLMYGPPGTGKTMAAQVIANELQMDLYRVDLSQVSSKYVGETAKNLERIFREAQQANVILFFDEADSLFGKRTEVKESNDKYANQETSYILQRIESYDGMVILATNIARNFDPAFMRRITISIQFEMPDEEMRRQLWEDMLQDTELGGNEKLISNLASQFELSGSNIKSIVRNAVYMALMEQRKLDAADIAAALRIEYEKMGRMLDQSNMVSILY